MFRKQHPTEPVVDDNGESQGGFAWIAGQLNALHPNRPRPISRQLVHKWWVHRAYNRFPEAIGKVGSGKGRPIFSRGAVIKWYDRYRDTRGTPLEEGAGTHPPALEPHTQDTDEGDALAA
jgi:hypothetical protein